MFKSKIKNYKFDFKLKFVSILLINFIENFNSCIYIVNAMVFWLIY